jgi:hypothetical protein
MIWWHVSCFRIMFSSGGVLKMLHGLECVTRCSTFHLLMRTPQQRLAHKLLIFSWQNFLWCTNNHVKLSMKIINIIGNIDSNFISKATMILLKSLSHYCDDNFFAISSPFLFWHYQDEWFRIITHHLWLWQKWLYVNGHEQITIFH